jgi:hypothetical protein
MATDADHYNNTIRIPLWNGVNLYATITVIFAQLYISARPLNRDAKQDSAPAELGAQFAANRRAATLETSWQAAGARRAAIMASSSAEYFSAEAVALRARYGAAARGCARARGWGRLRSLSGYGWERGGLGMRGSKPLPPPTASPAAAADIVPAALAVSTAREGGKGSSLGG